MTPQQQRYSQAAVVLHWVIAAAILFMIIIGWRMGDEPKGPALFALFQLHKSVGISILLLTLVRIGWRLANPPPPYAEPLGVWEGRLSRWVHLGFYAALIIMPMSGWALVSTSRTQIPTLLFGIVPWPHLPLLSDLPAAARHGAHENAEAVHGLIAKALAYLLIPLHVGGALKHQWINRDSVLGRMIPGVKPSARFDPRALIFAAALIGVIVLAYRIYPPLKASAALPPQPSSPSAEIQPQNADPQHETDHAVGPAKTSPTKSAPANWTVSPSSQLTFATQWSGAPIQGRFSRWSADVRFSPDALDQSKLRVTVDLGSVSTGDAQRDETLPTSDWFDTARQPKAVFTSSSIRKTGPDRYEAKGTLALRGVTRPAVVAFWLTIKGDQATSQGTASINRSAYGVGQGEWASTDQIPAEVKVAFSLTATRKP